MPLLKCTCILRLKAADSNHTIIHPIIVTQVISSARRFNISMKTNYLCQHVQAVINVVAHAMNNSSLLPKTRIRTIAN